MSAMSCYAYLALLHAVTPQPTSRVPTIAFLPPPALYSSVVSQDQYFCRDESFITASKAGCFVCITSTALLQVKMGEHKAETPW